MSKRADQIRKAVEDKGYTVEEIHYLKPGAHLEKGGQEGGWEVYTDYDNVSGWTYQDVLDEIKDWPMADDPYPHDGPDGIHGEFTEVARPE